jgi:methyl-accepting chemotaxis protein
MTTLLPRLRQPGVATRLHMITLVALLALCGAIGLGTWRSVTTLEAGRVALLRSVAESAIGILARYENEERAGRLSRPEAQRLAAEAVRGIRYRGSEYVWINDMEPRVVMHPFRPDLEGQPVGQLRDPTGFAIFAGFVETVRRQGAGVVGYMWPRGGTGQDAAQPVEKLSWVQGFAPWGWVVGTGVYVDDIRAAQRAEFWTALAELVVAAALLAGLAALLARGLVRPLRAATEATRRIASGELDLPVPGTDRQDECGVLARALEALRDESRRARELDAAAQAERAARDRRQVALDRHTQDFGSSVSGVMASLGQSAEQMRRAAGEMAGTIERTRDSAAATAAGAEDNARDLASVAAATEEMTASVSEIARQVAAAAAMAQEADGRARATDSTVGGLSSAAAQIGDVVRLIGDIAGQTNLLALNATIEAARAGEAGKGFAVVASEVKQLAAQTARATGEIGQQIGAIQAATQDAVGAVREVGASIARLSEVAAAIAAAVEQQGASTREIAGNVQRVSGQNERAAGMMGEVQQAVQGADGTSRSLMVASEEVTRVAATLREEVDQFLAAMRGEEEDRRRYERVPCHGVEIRLLRRGAEPLAIALRDISRGGAALECGLALPAGTELSLEIPGVSSAVEARVARADRGGLAVAFRQDVANLVRVDAALARLAPRAAAA